MTDKSKFDKWLTSEIKNELKKVPSRIVEHAKTDKNAYEIVYSSVCRKLVFNEKSKDVKEAFKKAIGSK